MADHSGVLTGEQVIEKRSGQREGLVDRDEIFALSGQDEQVLQEVLEIFLISAGKDIEAIEQAYLTEHWRQIKDLSHRIKGSARYLGASNIAQLAQQVEQMANHQDQQGLARQLPMLIDGVFQLRLEVKQWLERLSLPQPH